MIIRKPLPKEGDWRIKSRFHVFPKRYGDTVYWWSRSYNLERYVYVPGKYDSVLRWSSVGHTGVKADAEYGLELRLAPPPTQPFKLYVVK